MTDNANFGITYLTKREWLAGQAIAGLCANHALSNAVAMKATQSIHQPAKTYAIMAREIADATLDELAKERP